MTAHWHLAHKYLASLIEEWIPDPEIGLNWNIIDENCEEPVEGEERDVKTESNKMIIDVWQFLWENFLQHSLFQQRTSIDKYLSEHKAKLHTLFIW